MTFDHPNADLKTALEHLGGMMVTLRFSRQANTEAMDSTTKNNVLAALSRLLEAHAADVVAANRRDLAACPPDDAVIVDRLRVDAAKVAKMAASVDQVRAQDDPAGRVLFETTRGNGLRIENRTVPFGTVLIVYEARPDVSVEAAAIALKAGNRILLKGGKEARETNLALVALWRRALEESGADADFVRYLDIGRDETQALIAGGGVRFDLVIPRGGDALIDFVLRHSKAPVIVSGRGNNFAYIAADADFEKALAVVLNGKSRLSVCNALDKVLIDEKIPALSEKIDALVGAFRAMSIDVIGDASVNYVNGSVAMFGEAEWHEEFLSAKIALAVVNDRDDAIARINKYSGGHSATILTEDAAAAADFMERADCAAVYHNASTRFTDGGEFGLGAEIAISTQKLHFRGPLGAQHLLTNKWFVFGDGQVR